MTEAALRGLIAQLGFHFVIKDRVGQGLRHQPKVHPFDPDTGRRNLATETEPESEPKVEFKEFFRVLEEFYRKHKQPQQATQTVYQDMVDACIGILRMARPKAYNPMPHNDPLTPHPDLAQAFDSLHREAFMPDLGGAHPRGLRREWGRVLR